MDKNSHRTVLQEIARRVMLERGFNTDFPQNVLEELKEINAPAVYKDIPAKDLRHLLWCSIDNEDSRDLDQLSYAEQLPGNKVRLLVAIADVDELVDPESGIDVHASQNTSSIYTVAQVFPMLPEKLSTDLSSLNYNSERAAIVVDMVVDEEGIICQSDVYCAIVYNRAKLDYEKVAAWLEGTGPIPEQIKNVEGLAENIKLQEKASVNMRELRYERGALDFETIESRPVFEGDNLCEMKGKRKNVAKNMIEDFMIACNVATAQYLASKNYPSIRRVVPKPKRWDRIIELAAEHGFNLSPEPDPKSLSDCFKYVKQNLPEHFTDMSFSVLKLMGGGEYIMELPNAAPTGHFGLAVKNYSHSTAPNRRYSDLITHRLLKSAMTSGEIPYTPEQLETIAKNCTVKEDNAKKVERQVEKSANAMLLESKIGETFEGIVSGAAPKGTWVKIYHPHVEGKLVKGFEGAQVGHKIKARLLHVDINSGFIDFEKVE